MFPAAHWNSAQLNFGIHIGSFSQERQRIGKRIPFLPSLNAYILESSKTNSPFSPLTFSFYFSSKMLFFSPKYLKHFFLEQILQLKKKKAAPNCVLETDPNNEKEPVPAKLPQFSFK